MGDEPVGGTDAESAGVPFPTVALEMPSAQVLADQSATIQDLQFVMDCCKRLLAELAKPADDQDLIVALALWSAALVAYARCFSKGSQFGLDTDDVRSLPLRGAVMKFHAWAIDERRKLTVHPGKPFTAAKVGAALSSGGEGGDQVAGIAIMSANRVLVDDIGVRQLGALASELAKQIAQKARDQEDVVLAEARRLSPDNLARLAPLRPGPAA